MQNQYYDVIEETQTGDLKIVPVRTPIEKVAFGDIYRMTGTYPECERYVQVELKKRFKRRA